MEFRKSIFEQKENTKDVFDITNFTYNNWDDILKLIFEEPTIEDVGDVERMGIKK
ncbi:hypothetical protein [uncultured Clostridium sp.]|uniref:hypothetical protein n=1 Tax=uncultured Clostridium sp. TaxID=59620 RepID=UPI0028F10150|nr:hypothetical protein [uncultured Clostridium sp.]